MFMIIMSKDRKAIMIKIKSIQVVKNFGGPKDGKYILTANGGFGEGVILAQYAEEKNAVDELEKIYAAMAEGAAAYRID